MTFQTKITNVPDPKFLRLLQTLHHHHKHLRKPDEFGVQLYQQMIDDYSSHGFVSDGKLGYLLNRLHEKGVYGTYYSKVHQTNGRKKEPHPLLEFYRQNPEKLILNAETYGLSVKDEIANALCGSRDSYASWVHSIIHREKVKVLQEVLSKVNERQVISELPLQLRKVLHLLMGQLFLRLDVVVDDGSLKLFRKMLEHHGVYDRYGLFE